MTGDMLINYALGILFLPLLSFIILILSGKRLPRQGDWVAICSVIITLVLSLGLYGVITRRNGIAVLMGNELILKSDNINLIAFARYGGMNLSGQVFALFVIIMAAAEAAVALAIIINIFNNLQTVNIDEAQQLKL